jgi:hypothetical protein
MSVFRSAGWASNDHCGRLGFPVYDSERLRRTAGFLEFTVSDGSGGFFLDKVLHKRGGMCFFRAWLSM